MLTEYVQKAMEIAHYEIIEEEGTYWGEIPNFQGVWSRAKNLEKWKLNHDNSQQARIRDWCGVFNKTFKTSRNK